MSHARNETSAPYQHPDTRNSLEALVLRKWEGILDGGGGRVGVAPALAALDELVELLEDLLAIYW